MIKVFIVEDEIIAVESLTVDLQKIGYEVVGSANDSEKALIKINQTSPDLVLIDINIKGEKDGIVLAEELRNINSIPVVYLTAMLMKKLYQGRLKLFLLDILLNLIKFKI